MIDVTPSRVKNTCFAQSCFGLSKQEMQFVLKLSGLNHTQKLVWIALASFHANNPDFSRHLSLNQFAHMLNMRALRLWRVILQLEVMGLVQVNRSEYLDYYIKQNKQFRYLLLNLSLKAFHFLMMIFTQWFRLIQRARFHQF